MSVWLSCHSSTCYFFYWLLRVSDAIQRWTDRISLLLARNIGIVHILISFLSHRNSFANDIRLLRWNYGAIFAMFGWMISVIIVICNRFSDFLMRIISVLCINCLWYLVVISISEKRIISNNLIFNILDRIVFFGNFLKELDHVECFPLRLTMKR